MKLASLKNLKSDEERIVFSWSSSYKTKVVAAVNRTPNITCSITLEYRVLYAVLQRTAKLSKPRELISAQ